MAKSQTDDLDVMTDVETRVETNVEPFRVAVTDDQWAKWAATALNAVREYDEKHQHDNPPSTEDDVAAYVNGQVVAALQAAHPPMVREAVLPTLDLLHRWYEYWRTSPVMPSKMPASLHTATATALVVGNFTYGTTYPVGDTRMDPSVWRVDSPSPIMLMCADCNEWETLEAGDHMLILGVGFVCAACQAVRHDA